MDIDMSALRGLVREKEISFPLLVEAIESALLIAYHRTEGSRRHARVELAVSANHRASDVARQVRAAVTESLPDHPTVAVLVTAVS